MSAFGGKADMAIELKFSTFDKMQATRTTSVNRGKMLSLGDRFVPHSIPIRAPAASHMLPAWASWGTPNLYAIEITR
jgi:hypothetical protein